MINIYWYKKLPYLLAFPSNFFAISFNSNLRHYRELAPQPLYLKIILVVYIYMYINLSCITGEMSPIGEGSISCGYLMYMYEGGIGGNRGGRRIPHLSRYNCSSNLDKSKKSKSFKNNLVSLLRIKFLFSFHIQMFPVIMLPISIHNHDTV